MCQLKPLENTIIVPLRPPLKSLCGLILNSVRSSLWHPVRAVTARVHCRLTCNSLCNVYSQIILMRLIITLMIKYYICIHNKIKIFGIVILNNIQWLSNTLSNSLAVIVGKKMLGSLYKFLKISSCAYTTNIFLFVNISLFFLVERNYSIMNIEYL